MEKLQEKLLEYFNRSDQGLEALDDENREYYTGVTIDFLKKFIVPEYGEVDILDMLCELHYNNQIRSLFCSSVHTVVFEGIRYNSYNWNYEHYNEIVEGLIKFIDND